METLIYDERSYRRVYSAAEYDNHRFDWHKADAAINQRVLDGSITDAEAAAHYRGRANKRFGFAGYKSLIENLASEGRRDEALALIDAGLVGREDRAMLKLSIQLRNGTEDEQALVARLDGLFK